MLNIYTFWRCIPSVLIFVILVEIQTQYILLTKTIRWRSPVLQFLLYCIYKQNVGNMSLLAESYLVVKIRWSKMGDVTKTRISWTEYRPLFQYVLRITDYRIKRIGASGAVFWRKLDAFRHEVVIIEFVCRIYQLDFNRFRRFQSSHRILKMKNWFHVSFPSCFSFRVCVFWWPYQPEGFH